MDAKNRLFYTIQEPILKVINTQIGRKLFGIDHEVPRDFKIVKVTPNSYIYENGKKLTQVFRCYDLFGKKLLKFSKISSVGVIPFLMSQPGTVPLLLPMLAVDTFFAGVGDGSINRVGEANWASAHDNTAGENVDYGGSGFSAICQPAADGGWRIDRAFVPFDTSSLPDGAAIEVGTVNVMPSGKTDNVADVTIDLIVTTQASSTELVVGDFDQVGTTEQATAIEIADMSVDVYSTYNLSATGIASISKTAYTNFGLRTSHDTDNSACTDSATNTSAANFYASETSGTLKDPYLTATYPSGSGLQSKYW